MVYLGYFFISKFFRGKFVFYVKHQLRFFYFLIFIYNLILNAQNYVFFCKISSSFLFFTSFFCYYWSYKLNFRSTRLLLWLKKFNYLFIFRLIIFFIANDDVLVQINRILCTILMKILLKMRVYCFSVKIMRFFEKKNKFVF